MKLIINADDFGLSESVNQAIIELAVLGTVTSTTVMVNMPYFQQITDVLKYDNFSIGLHINLTQGIPVTDPTKIPSLVNKKGEFNTASELRRRVIFRMVNFNEVFIEIKSQYDLLYSLIGDKITHFDSHQDILKFGVIAKALMALKTSIPGNKAVRVYNKYFLHLHNNICQIEQPNLSKIKKYGLIRILIEFLLQKHTKRMGKLFKHGDGFILTETYRAYDILNFLSLNSTININKTFEICCHPATSYSDLPATKLKEVRVKEYNLLKSDDFLQISSNVELISYKNLK